MLLHRERSSENILWAVFLSHTIIYTLRERIFIPSILIHGVFL